MDRGLEDCPQCGRIHHPRVISLTGDKLGRIRIQQPFCALPGFELGVTVDINHFVVARSVIFYLII